MALDDWLEGLWDINFVLGLLWFIKNKISIQNIDATVIHKDLMVKELFNILFSKILNLNKWTLKCELKILNKLVGSQSKNKSYFDSPRSHWILDTFITIPA